MNDLIAWTALPMPSVEEAQEMARSMPLLFPDPEVIDAEWIAASQQYQALFGLYFLEKTGLDRLELRLGQRQIPPAPLALQDYFQKYSCMGLQYFYLWSPARVDRLSEAECRELRSLTEEEGDKLRDRAMEFAEATFSRVIPIAPEEPKTTFLPYSALIVEYAAKGGEIPLALRSVPSFREDRELVSMQVEEKRLRTLTSIVGQVNTALSSDLGFPVKVSLKALSM